VKVKFSGGITNKNDAFRAYTFTNENLDGYMGDLCENAKSGLIVSASGDQAITASMYGVRDITAFDVNPTALFFTDLKLKSLATLEYEEYIKFYTGDGKNKYDRPLDKFKQFLNRDVYDSFKNALEPQTRAFWDNVYATHNKELMHIGSTLFGVVFDDNHPMVASIPYLKDKQAYKRAQESLKELNIDFVNTNLVDGATKGRNYDIGMLSNIHDHVSKYDMIGFFHKVVRGVMEQCNRVQAYHFWGIEDVYSPYHGSMALKHCINSEGFNMKSLTYDASKYTKDQFDKGWHDCAIIVEGDKAK